MRGQKQCQVFLWLFFRSLPPDYNGKMQISRTHSVSKNFTRAAAGLAHHPQLSVAAAQALGVGPWLPKHLHDRPA